MQVEEIYMLVSTSHGIVSPCTSTLAGVYDCLHARILRVTLVLGPPQCLNVSPLCSEVKRFAYAPVDYPVGRALRVLYEARFSYKLKRFISRSLLVAPP